MTTLATPETHLIEVESGGYIVAEKVTRVVKGGMVEFTRDRLWGIILPVDGMWQATDPDGNDVGNPVEKLTDAVDILFAPVRTS